MTNRKRRKHPPKIVRNQNIAFHPSVWEKTPPIIGPTATGDNNPA
jgi:hypothetical protein